MAAEADLFLGVGMSVCGRKDCQRRLPCEMKHIITLRPAHVWDAGSRMPDAKCPAQPSPAYSYSPEEHVCRAAEKRLHDDGAECVRRGMWAVGCGMGGVSSFGLYASTVKSFLTCHG